MAQLRTSVRARRDGQRITVGADTLGYRAYIEGQPKSANPFAPQPAARLLARWSWMSGWTRAEREAAAAKTETLQQQAGQQAKG